MNRQLYRSLLALLLLGGPLLAAAGEPQGDGQDKEPETSERRVVVVSPEGAAGHTYRVNPRVEVVVVGERKEGQEDEARRFVWRGEDGEVHELEGPGSFVFAPGAPRGFLGVQLTDMTPELRAFFGAPADAGVLVAQVVPDSPAARAGLKVGDVLTHLDGEALTSSFDATARIGAEDEGTVVGLDVVRDRRVETLSATLEKRERAQIAVGPLLRRIGGEGDALTYEFDAGAFKEQMEQMQHRFSSPEWKQQAIHLEGLEEGLRERLEKLEEEMQKLQIQIDTQVRVESDEDDGN